MNKKNINRKITKMALEYCSKKLGLSKYNGKIPTLYISRDKLKGDPRTRGFYSAEMNTIVLYPKAHDSFVDFINTIIHEYVHYTQDLTKYTVLYRSYGYDAHPQEIEADTVATKHQWMCKNYIKEKMLK